MEPHTHTLSLSHNPLLCVWRYCRTAAAAARPGTTTTTRYWLVSTVRLLGLPDSTVQSSAAACQCVSRPLGSVQYRRARCCCFFFLSLSSLLDDVSPSCFFVFPSTVVGGFPVLFCGADTYTTKKKGPGLCVKCVPVVDSSILSHCGELAGKISVLNGCVCAQTESPTSLN